MNFLSHNKYRFLLLFIGFLIVFLNYTPNTWLTGWDTLHPELNYGENFIRLFNGVWRNDQGLGSVAGHSHMADIPRVIQLFIFDVVAPTSFVRYLYIFLMFLLGPIGLYSLLQYFFSKHIHKDSISFIGSLFYMFSAGTAQQFYVPFEMFPTQYAYVPLLILFSLKILDHNKPKDYFFYALLTLLAAPQAYAAQLWYAFFGTYVLFLAGYIYFSKNRLTSIKRSLILFFITILINSFWLLPNIYYVTTQSKTPMLAKQNRLYSQEFQLRNREFGHLDDVALQKGFYFGWGIYDFNKERVTDLMPAWVAHYDNPVIVSIGYGMFILMLFGILISIIKKGHRRNLLLLPFFLLPFILLANSTPPFNFIFDTLIKIPLFNEALRFVFTKVSILLLFSYAFYIACGFGFLLGFFNKRSAVSIAALSSMACLILLIGLPMFQGNLISPAVRITIPQRYFQFWQYMNTQPTGTTLTLPLHTFSGWQYYSWGYQGSGFIWFPLKQSVLDRDSDRWNNYNEESFREIQYALYSNNHTGFTAALNKYRIKYIVWDTSNTTIDEKNREQIVYSREINTIINKLLDGDKIKKIASFETISVYKIVDPTIHHNIIEMYNSLPNILPHYTWGYIDTAFSTHGNYISDITNASHFYYPFRSYLNIYDRFDQGLVSTNTDKKTYTINLPRSDLFQENLQLPNISIESDIYGETYFHKTSKTTSQLIIYPILPGQKRGSIVGTINLNFVPSETIRINDKQYLLPARNDKITYTNNNPFYTGTAHYYLNKENFINGTQRKIIFEVNARQLTNIQTEPLPEFITVGTDQMYDLNKDNPDVMVLREKDGQSYIRIASKQITTSGILVDLDTLPQSRGYVIAIESRNIKGIPLRVCLFNLYSNLCSYTDEVTKNQTFIKDAFVIPPYGEGVGYSLRLDNITYGGQSTINDIKEITIFPLPFNFLINTYAKTEEDDISSSMIRSTSTSYLNDTIHQVELSSDTNINNQHNAQLVLWKSFSEGWIALDTKKQAFLRSHHTVNNWANGWSLAEGHGKTFIIFFWPQLLEYIGFICIIFIVILTIFAIYQSSDKHK